ncbi:MAG TPA: type II secretion system protein [Blastocatellia bacterium]|nr:type II secretion system protein [Blastocatellia bacterium]
MMADTLNPISDSQKSEGGWAMLGLILALMILGIALTAAAPNIKTQVQREKEAELIYRGEQMAEAIARYYNFGNLGVINLRTRPPYGYLTELEKLRDGITMGVRELKFARPSALIDPMTNEEWEPVRMRDPRIMPALQAFAAEKGVQIPDVYLMIAGPPPKLNIINRGEPERPDERQPTNSNQATPPGGANQNSGGAAGGRGVVPDDPDADADDDDDDDDDDQNDPLAHLLQLDNSNLPIVGVATKKKGPSVRNLYGLKNYEEWVFIFIPDPSMRLPAGNINRTPGGVNDGGILRRPNSNR